MQIFDFMCGLHKFIGLVTFYFVFFCHLSSRKQNVCMSRNSVGYFRKRTLPFQMQLPNPIRHGCLKNQTSRPSGQYIAFLFWVSWFRNLLKNLGCPDGGLIVLSSIPAGKMRHFASNWAMTSSIQIFPRHCFLITQLFNNKGYRLNF